MSRKQYIKTIVTATSMIAIAAGVSQEAWGDVRVTTTKGPNRTSDGSGFFAPAAFNNGDSI